MSHHRPLAVQAAAAIVSLALAAGDAAASQVEDGPPAVGYALLARLMSPVGEERREAARQLLETGDASLVPGLVDALYFADYTVDDTTLVPGENALRGEVRFSDWLARQLAAASS